MNKMVFQRFNICFDHNCIQIVMYLQLPCINLKSCCGACTHFSGTLYVSTLSSLWRLCLSVHAHTWQGWSAEFWIANVTRYCACLFNCIYFVWTCMAKICWFLVSPLCIYTQPTESLAKEVDKNDDRMISAHYQPL